MEQRNQANAAQRNQEYAREHPPRDFTGLMVERTRHRPLMNGPASHSPVASGRSTRRAVPHARAKSSC
jgi:hypothetical protein